MDIKLSEAIRLGAMLRPEQAFFELLDAFGATCALGAAAEAVGILDVTTRDYRVGVKAPASWKPVVLRPVNCPVCAGSLPRVDEGIKHLNNDHRWTRERIAAWVETVEARQAVGAVAAPVDEHGNRPIAQEREQL